ncbi:unnamed protein product [Leptosia nina]|uniref:Uncharacterized protein n=1 Tax=Leptosia nina TaxID=320188 RepID=A0AAV1ITW8_9NEOP
MCPAGGASGEDATPPTQGTSNAILPPGHCCLYLYQPTPHLEMQTDEEEWLEGKLDSAKSEKRDEKSNSGEQETLNQSEMLLGLEDGQDDEMLEDVENDEFPEKSPEPLDPEEPPEIINKLAAEAAIDLRFICDDYELFDVPPPTHRKLTL